MNLIAKAGGRASFAQGVFPGGFVILAIAVNNERLLAVRQDDFGGSEFGGEPALDFYPLVEAEFVCEKAWGKDAEENR